MIRRYAWLLLFMLAAPLRGQLTDLVAIHQINPDELSFQLFENEGTSFRKTPKPFLIRSIEFRENLPLLNLAGDFDGDGVDEVAVFTKLTYTPNMNPEFTCSVIKIYKSSGNRFEPRQTWYSTLDSILDFTLVSHALAADMNRDGLADITLIYNDPSQDQVQVYVLESEGGHFSEPVPYFVVDRNEFNFTALSYASSGDFNGNGMLDIALFYNYFGTAPETKQAIFLLELNGQVLHLLPAAYTGTKQDFNFSELRYAGAGDYNRDGNSDLAVIRKLEAEALVEFQVFEGSEGGMLTPLSYKSLPLASLEFSRIGQVLTGEFTGDGGSDLALFYDDPLSGGQEIRVLESVDGTFKTPAKHFVSSPELLRISDLNSVIGGRFIHAPLLSVCTWKDDRKGAVSFTFDDGARGAFEHGASALESFGLKGTFYIFTDTSSAYDFEIAETDLIRSYRNLGHELASHTHNHANLGLLSEMGNLDSLNQVLVRSKKLLNERYDQQTFTLSIPYGSFRYETLSQLSRHFFSARSSQYGFNLSTPYDFFALRSWPVLSSTSPDYVNLLVERASNYGYYLPLMYHDLSDEPFDEEAEIYRYGRDLFRETLQLVAGQDVWIDTHANIYKYIRERNALRIREVLMDEAEADPGQFSFVLSSHLPDSIYDVELSLKIWLPETWNQEHISLEVGDSLIREEVLRDPQGQYVLCNTLPVDGRVIKVHEGILETHAKAHGSYRRDDPILSVFPNPARSHTQIRVDGEIHGQLKVMLLDLQGRKLKEVDMQGKRSLLFDVETLAPGLYLVVLAEGGIPRSSLKLLVSSDR